MSNSYYNHLTYPTPNSPGSSAQLRAELESITAGFSLLPTLSSNGYKVAMINSGGTAMTASAALQALVITSSTINSTVIGASNAAAGTFTNLTVTGTSSFGTTTVITGGTINGTSIGATTASTGVFTTVSASSGFSGNLSGNSSGVHTGSVTGNVNGNLTGNVTASSGTSAFTNLTISGTLDMDAGTTNTIINLATPINSGDAATKGYVDTGLALKLNLSGGTLSGAIAMGTSKITGLGDPTLAQDATTKTYTDTGLALKLNLTGGTMSGAIVMGSSKITGLGDPSSAQDAATKNYVDNTAQGLDAKPSCLVATSTNIMLSGTQTIDGTSVATGDRVLVKDQTNQANNGIYLCAAGSWTRATDTDTWAELVSAFTFIENGSSNGDSGWVCTVAQGGTLGSTDVTWVQFSGAGQITAGAGLTKTGNTLDIGTASSSRIVVNSDSIDLATTAVSAGTYAGLTVDAYGRVTLASTLNTLSGYGITNAYTTAQVDSALALKLNLTGGTMSGAIAMGTSKITGLGDPSSAQDAATKTYTDTGLALKLNLTGGTMSGAIAMGASKITGLGDPSSAQDAATKTYVDASDALKLNLSGGTMSGAIAMGASKITGLADPTLAQDATTKLYVDNILGSATSAATSAAAAAVSASNSGNSATAASTSATAAATSATNALSSLNTFKGQYYGALSTDPAVDPLGSAMTSGDLYFNTSILNMKVYDGASWLVAYIPASGYLALSGGTMTGEIVFTGAQLVPVANGGTGATTANTAMNALAPSQTGNSTKFLTTDGANTSWAAVPPGMVYPGSGIPVSTGSAWTTSKTSPSGAIVGTTDVQTLINKQWQAYNETATIVGTVATSTYNIDLSLSNIFDITLGANVAFTFTNPPTSGISRNCTVILRQDATGSRLATFAGAKFTDGTAPILSTGASQIDVLSFFTLNGGSFWFGTFAMANVS